MDFMDPLRVGGGFVLLMVAAAQDLRDRQVGDWVWAVMGGLAFVVGEIEVLMSPLPALLQLALAALALLYFDALWERQSLADRPMAMALVSYGLYLTSAFLLVYAGARAYGTTTWAPFLQLLGVAVMILLAYGFYTFGLLRGGADAKAFMAIAVLFPHYPSLGALPLVVAPAGGESVEILFPFALTALLNGALFFLLFPLGFLALNMSRGDLAFPQALLGYRASLERPPRHVWWMEEIRGGSPKVRLFPRRDQDPRTLATELRAAGLESAWATPQIPLLVPLTGGFALAVVVGNLFLALLLAL